MGIKKKINTRAGWMKRIHGEANKRGFDHDFLHDMAVEEFRVKSLADCETWQLQKLFEKLTGTRVKRRRAPTEPASEAQKKYIADLRPAAGLNDEWTFRAWMAKKFKIFKTLDNLNNGEAYKVIEALKKMGKRFHHKA